MLLPITKEFYLLIYNMEQGIFDRSVLLLGKEAFARLSEIKVIIFGVGGVGSWCAESLVRSGVRHLTIVDSERISASNVNRQLMALSSNIGQLKVDAMRERLLQINPDADIITITQRYSEENSASFNLSSYDYIIDAIDSLKDKASLILRACESGAVFFCSMGAALKVDPTLVREAEFWNVRGCPLGAALRKKYKREKTFPSHNFRCIYGEQVLPNLGIGDLPEESVLSTDGHACVNGSLSCITGIFGLSLAGLVIKDVYRRVNPSEAQCAD